MSTAEHFIKTVFFDENYYLAAKTAALNASGMAWSTEDTRQAIASIGLTPWQHFSQFGAFEQNANGTLGIDPSAFFSTNSYYQQLAQQQKSTVAAVADSMQTDPLTHYATTGFNTIKPEQADSSAQLLFGTQEEGYRTFYFNETEYLENKTAQLNAYSTGETWTAETTRQAITNAGMTPWQHFSQFGAFERNADGDIGIDPSDYFDISRYYADKASMLGMSVDEVVSAFAGAGLDPVTHYARHGYMEDVVPTATNMVKIAGAGVSNIPLSGNLMIDALISKDSNYSDINKLGQSQNNVLYYHFMTDDELASFNYTNGNRTYSTYSMTDSQQYGVSQTLDYINKVTGITFIQTSNISQTNLCFLRATNPEMPTASWCDSKFWDGSKIGVAIAHEAYWDVMTKGSQGFSNTLHEVGHALGLKHPFDTGDGNDVQLPGAVDNHCWTQQSYTFLDNNWNINMFSYCPADILALQYLYGTDGLNGSEGITYDDTVLA